MKCLLLSLMIILLFPISCVNKKDCDNPNFPQSSYHIKVGDRIDFELKGCQTCGYQWQWHNENNSHLKKLSTQQVRCAPSLAMGGEELNKFVFEATASGKDSIVMWNHPPNKSDTIASQDKQVMYVTID